MAAAAPRGSCAPAAAAPACPRQERVHHVLGKAPVTPDRSPSTWRPSLPSQAPSIPAAGEACRSRWVLRAVLDKEALSGSPSATILALMSH